MTTSTWRKTLLYTFRSERVKLLNAMVGLDDYPLSNIPLWDDWTVERLLPHIASWEAVEADRISRITSGRSLQSHNVSVDELNAGFHEKYRHMGVDAGVAMLQKERNSLLHVIAANTDEQLHSDFTGRDGKQYSLTLLLKNCHEHDTEHANGIAHWRKEQNLTENVTGPKSIMVALLRASLHELRAAAEFIPADEQTTRAVCGTWTLKQLIDHLAGWEQITIEGLRNCEKYIGNPDEANATAVAARAHNTLAESWNEYRALRKQTIQLFEQMEPEKMAAQFSNAKDRCTPYVWVRETVLHEMGHSAELHKHLTKL